MSDTNINKRAEWAKLKNMQGYTCSQAIALAYQDLADASPETLYRMSEGFGGGMGKMQEICGLLTGLYMIVGMLFSDFDKAGKTKLTTYEKIRDLHHAFKAELGSAHCYVLLKGGEPSFKKCRDKFDVACRCFEKLLADNAMTVPPLPDFMEKDLQEKRRA